MKFLKLNELKELPIAVFDSGVGGISVLRALLEEMPNENYRYYGDSANAPYGTKSLEEVRGLTIAHVDRLIYEGAKAVVVACNTATSAAVAVLREMYPKLPLVGIEPAIKPAVLACPRQRIVVMATPMTLCQEKFQKLMHQYEDMAQIIPLPCPGLMEFVERGDLDSEELHKYLTELLWGVQKEKIAAIVLGCTHYPFARKMISEVVGSQVSIFDGGNGTAREMHRRLMVADKLSEAENQGSVEFLNSRNTQKEQELCQFLLSC